jgi:formylmethanofuran dehydrogenase subunit E
MYSFQQFKEKADKVHNGEYTYDCDGYVNMGTKLKMTHKICGNTFFQLPKNHLRGQGCPLCGKERAKKRRKGNYKSFIAESKNRFGDRYIFPNIESEYENSHSIITVECTLCGSKFNKIACDFITSKTGGCWCKEKKTAISYNELVEAVSGYNIEHFDGELDVTKGKVTVTCNKCGFQYSARITSLLNGKNRCKSCAGREASNKRRLSVEAVKKRMDELWPTINVDYSTYVNAMSKMRCTCKKCGNEFERSPNGFFSRNIKIDPCPKCSKELLSGKKTKTTEQFIDDVKMVYGDGIYTVIGEYTSSNSKIRILCNDCHREFDIEANSFLQGYGCPYHNCNSSGKEKEISEFIKSLLPNDKVYTNDRKLLNGKELDVLVPSMSLAFEFDGVFWHNENNKENDYHISKTMECEKHGIRLIHIFEDEWIYKKEIWKSMIRNVFSCTQNKIYGRKCEIKEVEVTECTKFLNENHLQGWCPSQVKLGLYHNGVLVSVMTFGKSRHYCGNGRQEYELLRFCNKLNTNVIGGASKLFTHFISEYNPKSIISFADRRWSNGGLYKKLGFTFDHCSKPNYFYVIGNVRKNRFNYRKSVLVEKYGCPKSMTEKEFCRQQKWYRIYDCGTMVYKWASKK